MKKCLTLIISLGFVIFFVSSLQADEIKRGERLSLARCLEIAFKRNPTILSAMANLRLYETKVGQAKSNYYPQVSWQTNASRTGPYSEGVDQYKEYATNIGLSQNIFDFNRTPLKVEIAKINTKSVVSDLEEVRNEVALAVKQAFFNLLQAQKNREIAEETVKQFELHLKQAQGFYEAGTKPRVDVTKAEVDLNNARLNLIRAENAVRLARIGLNNAMGLPDAQPYTLADELTVSKSQIELDQAVLAAYKNRPDLQSLILKQEAARKSLDLAYKNHFPTISGSANYGFGGSDFPLSRGWTVGANINIPIFSGFLVKYQVEEAKFNLELVTAQIENLKNEIRREVEQAYSNLIEAQESIRTAEVGVKYAKENADLATGRYQVGVGNAIEVTDALVALANAQTNYISALTNYKQAEASLEKAMGRR
ncbi:MAG TPA: TolC family protein [Syntrophales bacterium]|nr:TolC family protein [Syntrophales bacterium]HOL59322.1 TolC family protein [Syntrophales bacterium]HPO35485.1 TolC family protein [Syntrophales bacterium]